ncbi:MAG: hypothetical protein SVV03_04365 [Candidatus Nanohaloarchaea archaeon]|nr:hypothetical protein [Candidatus Nanohaloarchaea archaeon]
MIHTGTRKGFIKTLEAVIAASIFFIFIFNTVPQVTGRDSTSSAIKERVSRHLEALDKEGKLRQDIVDRDLEGVRSELRDDFGGHNVAVGLSYLGRVRDRYEGGDYASEFQVDKSSVEREVLRLWVDREQGLEVFVNGDMVVSSPGQGYMQMNISGETVDGENNLNITSTSGKLFYQIDKYNYIQTESLPEKKSVTGLGYMVAGKHGNFQPSELRVYLWR